MEAELLRVFFNAVEETYHQCYQLGGVEGSAWAALQTSLAAATDAAYAAADAEQDDEEHKIEEERQKEVKESHAPESQEEKRKRRNSRYKQWWRDCLGLGNRECEAATAATPLPGERGKEDSSEKRRSSHVSADPMASVDDEDEIDDGSVSVADEGCHSQMAPSAEMCDQIDNDKHSESSGALDERLSPLAVEWATLVASLASLHGGCGGCASVANSAAAAHLATADFHPVDACANCRCWIPLVTGLGIFRSLQLDLEVLLSYQMAHLAVLERGGAALAERLKANFVGNMRDHLRYARHTVEALQATYPKMFTYVLIIQAAKLLVNLKFRLVTELKEGGFLMSRDWEQVKDCFASRVLFRLNNSFPPLRVLLLARRRRWRGADRPNRVKTKADENDDSGEESES